MEAFPMKSGDGPQSYAQNSSYQELGVTTSLNMMREVIAKDEEVGKEELSSWNTIRIADLGCSIGPNTFKVAEALVDCMTMKYNSHGLHAPDFHVFFNDQASNDFNTLFLSLPTTDAGRPYFPAAVPGSFYGRLFPEASLHLVYSSYTLHWLSQTPVAVRDSDSPAWNKGRIYLNGAPPATARAYGEQFSTDMNMFLSARAEEVIGGGYVGLVFLCSAYGVAREDFPMARILDMVGSTLMEMAQKGLVEEAKIDSFNMPMYLPSLEEIHSLVKKNDRFRVERVEPIFPPYTGWKLKKAQDLNGLIRAVIEPTLCTHFGPDILNQLFQLTLPKIEEQFLCDTIYGDSLVLLKRNYN